MKIIFLDIDGVLNNPKTWGLRPVHKAFSKECVEAFNLIIESVDADIVISSTWRNMFNFDDLIEMLKGAGVAGHIIGKTPSIRFSGAERGDEIARWLDRASEEAGFKITKFVILDDDSDMGYLFNYLVRCNPETGITEKEVKKAIEMLNE